MNYSEILNYWFPNEDYNEFWFDTSPDEYIKKNYLNLLNQLEDENNDLFKIWNETKDGKIALIIILDQFTRNIYRNTDLIYKNDKLAFKIAKDIFDNNYDITFPLNYRIFSLMPYRHNKNSESLDFVMNKIKIYENEFKNNKLLEKFKIATIMNYTNLNDRIVLIKNNINHIAIKDFEDILDPICYNYTSIINNNLYNYKDKIKDMILYNVIKAFFENKIPNISDRIIGISLSGGVDSMVILFLLKMLQINNIIKNVYAIHLEYINREESKKETKIITAYCNILDVPIFIRKINYFSRVSIDRNFYESETKKIRFNTYKYLINKYNIKGFCLGHHFGDMSENVLMNIFNGRDILDLFVMEDDSIINEVRIFRPLLKKPKNDIYYIAHKYEIPYLKDSTPDWSCRGVLRKQIMPKLVDQWGEGIINNLAGIGQKSKEWESVVNNFILKPIYESIEYKKFGCKINLKKEFINFPKIIWEKIFLKIFHNMGICMISKKNLDSFLVDLEKKINNNSKITFSNNCFGIIHNYNMYIFKNIYDKFLLEKNIKVGETLKINNFIIVTKKINFNTNNEIRNKITYDDILNGYYCYTEQYLEDNLNIINKFNEKDITKKIFTEIPFFKDYIPKITSGYNFKPENMAYIEILFI